MMRRVPGAILIGMGATAAAGYATGLRAGADRAWWRCRSPATYSLAPIALHLDIAGVLRLSFLPVLLTLVLMSFLDTLGHAGRRRRRGQHARQGRQLPAGREADAGGRAVVRVRVAGRHVDQRRLHRVGHRHPRGRAHGPGGRRHGAALRWRRCSSCRWSAPLQQSRYAYGPALIAVGMLMVGSMRKIDFDDLTEALPAFACIALMVFTYNIANGLTAGPGAVPDGEDRRPAARASSTGAASCSRCCASRTSCSGCRTDLVHVESRSLPGVRRRPRDCGRTRARDRRHGARRGRDLNLRLVAPTAAARCRTTSATRCSTRSSWDGTPTGSCTA